MEKADVIEWFEGFLEWKDGKIADEAAREAIRILKTSVELHAVTETFERFMAAHEKQAAVISGIINEFKKREAK